MSSNPNNIYKNNNSKNKNKKEKKIILNTPEDLLNISKEEFDKINVLNLFGDYYEQLYKEALKIEEKNVKLKINKKSKDKNNDTKIIKSKIYNMQKNQTNPLKSILRNNHREKVEKKISKSKSRSKSKEKNIIKSHKYKILANQLNVDISNSYRIDNSNSNNDKKHLFSPEIISKKTNLENINSKNMNNTFNISLKIPKKKKIKVNLLPSFDKVNNNNTNKMLTPKNKVKINNDVDKSKEIFSNSKSDEIKDNKNSINGNDEYKINKIIFNIRYDSNYGDNIGILGSIEQLGNWSQDKILYLKWNNGNIWKGDIDWSDSNISKFEFKFINRYDGIIYWEKGYNNVVDLTALIEELKYRKRGRFNKYEYNYDINNSEITLNCKIKGWE